MEKIKELLLKGPLPTQGMLAARVLVGGYLIYLSKSLIDGRNDSGMNPVVLYLFIAIFLIVGAVLCIKAVYNFAAGYYKGGKLDIEASEDEILEESSESSTIIDVDENEIEELDK